MAFTASPAQTAIRLDEPVRNLLRQKPSGIWSISPDSSVYEAIEVMSDHKVGALAVLSGHYLAGIISERDYARKVILRGRNSRETLVREIMSSPVLFVRPEQTVEECMQVMSSRRIRHLPVLEGDTVTGMLSIGDLVNWIVQSQGQTILHLTNYIVGSYPA